MKFNAKAAVTEKAVNTRTGVARQRTEYEEGLFAYLSSMPKGGVRVHIEEVPFDKETAHKTVANHLANLRRALPDVTITGPNKDAGEIGEDQGVLAYIVGVKGKVRRNRQVEV